MELAAVQVCFKTKRENGVLNVLFTIGAKKDSQFYINGQGDDAK